MQTFSVKKLAEVQAFINLSQIILDRAGKIFEDQATDVAKCLTDFNINLEKLLKEPGESQVFKAKMEKTTYKLTTMMELYIGDEWDNPVEVLEWLSFYAGSAAAHSALVCSVLDSTFVEYDTQIHELSDKYLNLLNEVIATLKTMGGNQSSKE